METAALNLIRLQESYTDSALTPALEERLGRAELRETEQDLQPDIQMLEQAHTDSALTPALEERLGRAELRETEQDIQPDIQMLEQAHTDSALTPALEERLGRAELRETEQDIQPGIQQRKAHAKAVLFQRHAFRRALTKENLECGVSKEGDGGKDTYDELHPGRRVRTDIVGPHRGCKRCVLKGECTYTVDILDAKSETEHEDRCRVFLVPPQRTEEWLFSSIEGQWQVVADSKSERLIMVAMVGNEHDNDIQHMKDDVSPLVTRFLPSDCRSIGAVEYLTQDNRVKFRRTVELIVSSTTGPILVEDVGVAPKRPRYRKHSTDEVTCYRRLLFRRNPNMIQSEALLIRDEVREKRKKRARWAEKGNLDGLKIDYSCLTNEYHEAMIAAFILIGKEMKQWKIMKKMVRVMIIGLGAGLLPMFVHKYLPVDDIQVVELDPIVGKIAKDHFGFCGDKRMKLHIGDGVLAVKAIADAARSNHQSGPGVTDSRVHVLIVDTDSNDPSNGLSCPAPECLEDSFLLAAREALVDGGMLIMNVVARARRYDALAKLKLKTYFAEVYEIEIDQDVNCVLVAMAQPSRYKLRPRSVQNETCEIVSSWYRGPNLHTFMRNIKPVDILIS